jgi:hypothetical protein
MNEYPLDLQFESHSNATPGIGYINLLLYTTQFKADNPQIGGIDMPI